VTCARPRRESRTTLDSRLSRALEPRAASPHRRLAAIRRLAEEGIPVSVNLAPVIPGLNDHEIEAMVQAAGEAGAKAARHSVLRLPMEVATLFRDWLQRERPGEAAKIMARVRDLHGGRDYDPSWHRRMKGQGVHAALIERRVDAARRRVGLFDSLPPLRCDLFRVPPPEDDDRTGQLALDL
ncbi:MAG: radical SAM protein, partial [Pseudomonadota bacterium]